MGTPRLPKSSFLQQRFGIKEIPMIGSFVRGVGEVTISWSRPFIEMTSIAGQTLRSFFRLSFFNPAVFRSLIKQVHVSSVQALPGIFIAALILGSITVHFLLSILTGLGAYDKIGEYLIYSMLHEIAPIACTIILMFRSGTAVISEISIMKIHKELDTLEMLGIRRRDYVFLPRVLAFAFAGPSLTITFSLVALFGGFLILGYFQDITFDNYKDQILYALDLRSIFILLAKPFFMSVGIAVMSIQRGLTVRKTFAEVPGKLIQGLMSTVSLIILVEIVFILFT